MAFLQAVLCMVSNKSWEAEIILCYDRVNSCLICIFAFIVANTATFCAVLCLFVKP